MIYGQIASRICRIDRTVRRSEENYRGKLNEFRINEQIIIFQSKFLHEFSCAILNSVDASRFYHKQCIQVDCCASRRVAVNRRNYFQFFRKCRTYEFPATLIFPTRRAPVSRADATTILM